MNRTNNPFAKIKNTKSKVPNQSKKNDNSIIKKKVGRPKRPNSMRVEIRMHKILRARMDKYDVETGGCGPSAIIAEALIAFLTERDY